MSDNKLPLNLPAGMKPEDKTPPAGDDATKANESAKPDNVKKDDVGQDTVEQKPAEIVLPCIGKDEPFFASERMPSDWEISEHGEDQILAVSNRSNRRFIGTRKEFMAKLRAA